MPREEWKPSEVPSCSPCPRAHRLPRKRPPKVAHRMKTRVSVIMMKKNLCTAASVHYIAATRFQLAGEEVDLFWRQDFLVPVDETLEVTRINHAHAIHGVGRRHIPARKNEDRCHLEALARHQRKPVAEPRGVALRLGKTVIVLAPRPAQHLAVVEHFVFLASGPGAAFPAHLGLDGEDAAGADDHVVDVELLLA